MDEAGKRLLDGLLAGAGKQWMRRGTYSASYDSG